MYVEVIEPNSGSLNCENAFLYTIKAKEAKFLFANFIIFVTHRETKRNETKVVRPDIGSNYCVIFIFFPSKNKEISPFFLETNGRG